MRDATMEESNRLLQQQAAAVAHEALLVSDCKAFTAFLQEPHHMKQQLPIGYAVQVC
jgi:hypothetical protein